MTNVTYVYVKFLLRSLHVLDLFIIILKLRNVWPVFVVLSIMYYSVSHCVGLQYRENKQLTLYIFSWCFPPLFPETFLIGSSETNIEELSCSVRRANITFNI